MKRLLQINLVLMLSFSAVFAQTTATDFTATDCGGKTYNLFDELDTGNVIVICWVMPCGSCGAYAAYASNAVQAFATSHPGRVKYYLADDYGNSTCTYLNGWAMNYGLQTDARFSTNLISMSHYGTDGMPKVVVLGKSDYKIYYNKNDNKDINNENINDKTSKQKKNTRIYLMHVYIYIYI